MTGRAVAIGEVATLNPKPPALLEQDPKALVPFIPMAAVLDDGRVDQQARRPVAELVRGHTYFEKGDVLLAKITPCFENGKAAHLDSLPHGFGFGSTEFHVLRAGREIDPRYLYHAVRNPRFRQAGASSMTGSAGQQRVPVAFVARYRVPLPPLSEQQRIAAVLDRADAVRRKRRESLQLLDEFLRSAFLAMFGDPVRNPRRWPTLRLADVGQVITGSTPPTDDPDNYGTSGVPFIRPTELDSLLPIETSSKLVSKLGQRYVDVLPLGAVLFCGIGATIGKTGYTSVPVCVNQQIHAIIPDSSLVTPPYLFMVLRMAHQAIVERATTTTLPILKKSAFEQYGVPIPPLPQAQGYVKLFEASLLTRKRLAEAADGAQALLDSLAQRAFQGGL